ncbi:MAG: flagellar assembly protein FliW [Desulfobulbaceae bacterium]|nr:flagellar assembly protein FliW [Desulfobulbaceae bacterium]
MVRTTQENSPQKLPKESVMTSRFGEIEVDGERTITITSPFLGFPESNRFVLLPHSPSSPFMWLQSLDNPKLAFVVIQPGIINPEYNPAMNSQVREELMISGDDKLEFLIILTIPKDQPKDMTANLLGPVVINAKKRLAKQVLLDPAKYDPCWPVISGN